MVIDPRMYERLSGRQGDPYDRMGAALSEDSARSQSRKAEKERSASDRLVDGHFKAYKARWIISIVVSIIVLIAMAFGLLR
jgi:hypothetical protein